MVWNGQLNHEGTDGLAGMAESYPLTAGISKRELRKRKEISDWGRLATGVKGWEVHPQEGGRRDEWS